MVCYPPAVTRSGDTSNIAGREEQGRREGADINVSHFRLLIYREKGKGCVKGVMVFKLGKLTHGWLASRVLNAEGRCLMPCLR